MLPYPIMRNFISHYWKIQFVFTATPLRSFQVPAAKDSLDISTDPWAFVDNDRVAVLANGTGVVRLVTMETSDLFQELMHGNSLEFT